MNYCEKIKYRILIAKKETFPVMVDDLLNQLPENESVLRLAFFGTPPTNEAYLTRHTLLKEKVTAHYGQRVPAWSYVSQPPLEAALMVEVHSTALDEIDKITYGKLRDYPYTVLENNEVRLLFAGGFQSSIINESIERQSVEIFRQIAELLAAEGFPPGSIVRQWNYIERITGLQDGNQHYQSFNNARSRFYDTAAWPNGYPAATGIGTNVGGVVVDLDAAIFASPAAYATPVDNPLQIAAHTYSGKVLKTASEQKATPKFERAKSMTFGNRRLVYISGTAAIRGEDSLSGTGLEHQLHVTMENIAQLTGQAKPVILRVYLKNKADYALAKRLMNSYGLAIPVSYMCADVCRDELLIEIEGIAIE
jgi:enamine deaminase RidA (YjgF/YER057c/UK114 family)